MLLLKRVLGWVGRQAVLYLLFLAALLAAAFLVPWARAEWSRPDRHQALAVQLEAARGDLRDLADRAGNQTVDELDRAIIEAEQARAAADKDRRGGAAKALSLVSGNADTLLADGRRDLEIWRLDRELQVLRAARDTVRDRALLADLDRRAAETQSLWPACRDAAESLRAFEARWSVPADRASAAAHAAAGLHDWRVHADLQGRKTYACDRWRASDARRLALATGRQRAEQAVARADAAMRAAVAAYDGPIEKLRAAADGSLRRRLELAAERYRLSGFLWAAAVALALSIAAPFLIRLLCYFVVAPIAMRRPAIRVGPPGLSGATIPPVAPSTTSVALRLSPGEELVVRQGYLQTTGEGGAKDTQWLLDRRHPIISLATGLSFLTRIRGDGETVTVSAVRDPFAEVAVLTLPAGAACVLQPRALAAVAQPIGRRLRVTGHWRLFSLSAWLTLQLRYLVFHGPARLVLHGGRGVRVERAEHGRILGQDQVIGFSTDLAYAVTRTETFWPYFLGRESLLKDRVAAGDGVVILEEAPLAGRRGEPRRGLEGLIDAGLKVFGA